MISEENLNMGYNINILLKMIEIKRRITKQIESVIDYEFILAADFCSYC
ncbi:MAG: hypothetical protein WBK18_05470 [Thermacetogeniaceae bacterium]